MNVNEVIAHIARKQTKKINPNDHVNMSQSSNDVFPTAMHIAFCLVIIKKLIPVIDKAISAFDKLEKQYQKVLKIGRTHLQDATPITVAQEISGWKHALISSKEMIEISLTHLKILAIGGTAVGSGINAPKDFDKEVVKHINHYTGIIFETSKNKFHALSFKDAVANTHGTLQTLATSLFKIANDIR
jgi:fumarate hydratase class II